ncbi:MAG: helix-turn-helix transcriptional regulator [Chitinophagales bacterium]|jgi:YesN/AraC family two-component response regulator|nr:helix-turn-helix transcriptional regulator [Chitinophagales bacterium]
MKLYVKYMVSLRCKMVVRATIESMGLHCTKVELGEADIVETLTHEQHDDLKKKLHKSGLELLDEDKAILVERIKNVVVEMVHYEDELPRDTFSVYLTHKLHRNYAYLASLFSTVTGITIEHYIIAHKIEKAKELLLYDELSLKEIANKLHYSSVAHLSGQFKKETGLTPTFFKSLKNYKKRIALENVG